MSSPRETKLLSARRETKCRSRLAVVDPFLAHVLRHALIPRFVPVLFNEDISDGKGKLTERGLEALRAELNLVDHAR